jgi:hypothetical protein
VEGESMTDMKKYISRLFEISEDNIREEMKSGWKSFDRVTRKRANDPERPLKQQVIRNCIDSRADEYIGMITGMTKTLYSALIASELSRDESSYYFDLASAKSLVLRKIVNSERDKRMNNVDTYYDETGIEVSEREF